MGAAASGAGAASIASAGLAAYSSIEKGKGTQAVDDMKAAQAEQAAQFGTMQATLTDTVMRNRLTTTLGNIDAVRASANTDPTSPTTGAIEDLQRQVSERQRLAADVTLRTQAATDMATANYLKSAGDFAVMQGNIGAGVDIFSAFLKGIPGSGGGGGGGDNK